MVNLKDFNVSVSTYLAIFFMSFVAPGFLIFFLIDSQMFIIMDFWKLFILASSLAVPPFAFTLMFSASIYFHVLKNYPGHEEKWGGPREWYIRLGFSNSLSMYVIALLMWFFELGVPGFVLSGVIITSLNIIAELGYLFVFIRDPEAFSHGWLSALNRLLK